VTLRPFGMSSLGSFATELASGKSGHGPLYRPKAEVSYPAATPQDQHDARDRFR
jgi:hypothetical protein